jgi:hypothetical protein
MKNKKRDEKWNDNLDLYVDDVRVSSAPMSKKGMNALKDMAQAMMRSGVLLMGAENEWGDVYMPEIEPYIIGKARENDLFHIMPPEGYRWEEKIKEIA